MIPSAESRIEFLNKIQRILDEGKFTSTYKYALLLSLAELSVEKGDDSGEELTVSLNEIAEKFIRLYWAQSIPFPALEGEGSVLFQNTSGQAAVINHVSGFYALHQGSIARAKRSGNWEALVSSVRSVIVAQPLWKLQQAAGGSDEFLYRHKLENNSITLNPGVAYSFRFFYRLICQVVQGAWVNKVSGIKTNNSVLGINQDLGEFLFAGSRNSLALYKPFLVELQENRCFYCRKKMRDDSKEVDHFIPWARYPVDLGHNFVLSHKACNNSKRDILASLSHLQNWEDRNSCHGTAISDYCTEKGLVSDLKTSVRIAVWAYEQASPTGSDFWIGKGGYGPMLEPASDGWRAILSRN